MRRIGFAIALALVLALPASAAGWLAGDSCSGSNGASTTEAGPAVYCPTAANGADSPPLEMPRGGICSYDDGTSAATITLTDSINGVEFRELGDSVDCTPDVDGDYPTDCSTGGIYPGQLIVATASATCTDCRVVCRPAGKK